MLRLIRENVREWIWYAFLIALVLIIQYAWKQTGIQTRIEFPHVITCPVCKADAKIAVLDVSFSDQKLTYKCPEHTLVMQIETANINKKNDDKGPGVQK